jgi:hypothetical protein
MNLIKIKYFIRSFFEYFSTKECPNCGSASPAVIDRKYLVTRLMRCSRCKLQFRHPTDTPSFNTKFYQVDYEQNDGITTKLPNESELKAMIETDFKNSSKSIDVFFEIFRSISKNEKPKIIDYGCSWGYMSYQFVKRGIETQSFEISKSRAAFGREHMGLDIKTAEKDLKPGSSIFFSSHVIEHVPSITSMIELSKKLLTPTGYFIAECPNGSNDFRLKNPLGFHRVWGMVHPNYLNDEFYKVIFANNPYFITTTPYVISELSNWDQNSQFVGRLDGNEILIVVRPNIALHP